MFNAVNILEALKNYIRTHGGTSNAYNIAEAVNDLNSIPQGSSGIPEAPIDDNQYARKNGDWSKVESSGGDIPDEVTNAIETHGMGWTDEEEVEGFDIQWDGNTEGLENIMNLYFRVAIDVTEFSGVTSMNDLIGATVVLSDGGIPPYQITSFESFEDNVYAESSRQQILVITEDTERGLKGVYFAGGPHTEDNAYVSRLYKEASTEEVVHQIDQKYIPQSSGGAMIVNLTFVDFNTPIRADKTLLELGEAFSNGIPVIAKLYLENQIMISALCTECEDPYETCAMVFGSPIYRSESDSMEYKIIGYRKLDDDEETRIDFWECHIFG